MSTRTGRVIPVGVSGRHVHLDEAALRTLFGPDAALHALRDLSQTGQFAARETVIIAGPKGAIPNVRILGPTRSRTQVEISRTDCFQLGLPVALRGSGDLSDTPGVVIIGPAGALTLAEGAMVAMRHVHMSPQDAEEFGLADGDVIKVGAPGVRALIFDQVLVRVDPTYTLELHVDTDEANSAGLGNGDVVAVFPHDLDIPAIFLDLAGEQQAKGERDLAH